ncbi:P-loop containing nucleoside triphosphate hydrolase protein [Biscogniauxia marginata]|nr:P-loop containing nucleoside triphosphate hydrolase protein [Biscogniauxia marginata]
MTSTKGDDSVANGNPVTDVSIDITSKSEDNSKKETPAGTSLSSTASEPTGGIKVDEDEDSFTVNAYLRIFSFARPIDTVLQFVAVVAALGSGLAPALVNLVLGQFITVLTNYVSGQSTAESFMKDVSEYCIRFVYIGVGRLVFTYIYTTLSTYCAYHIVRNIRHRYLRAALSQEVAFFDQGTAGSISMQATSNGNLIQSGIAEKLALNFQAVSTFVAAFVVAFVTQWKLTLILICIVPTLIVLIGTFSALEMKIEIGILEILATAGSFAESLLATPKMTHAFGMQKRLATQYDKYLEDAQRQGFKKNLLYGILFSVEYFVQYAAIGLAFWQGVKMLVNGEIEDLGAVFTVSFSAIVGTFAITSVTPFISTFNRAASAASRLFTLIDRKSEINAFDESGEKPAGTQGVIDIENVSFSYPSRPGAKVLQDFSLHVPAGKVTALVGPSGSGKSTIVGLIERWYQMDSGAIKLDGTPIDKLNLNWLRTNVRLVQQEPVLFNGTVFENIANGLVGTPWERSPAEEQQRRVQAAAEFAFAHDFIAKLPEGYATRIGEKGGLLSGGQKQRVAIARSIISEPKVLLLDEATSALDPQSEAVVQKALDNVSRSRTTIVIAHRLATVKAADNIVIMAHGQIREQGSHRSLLSRGGAYAALVKAQDLSGEERDAAPDRRSTSVEDDEMKLSLNASRPQKEDGNVDRQSAGVIQELDEYGDFKQMGLINAVWYLIRGTEGLTCYYAIALVVCILAGGQYPGLAVLLAGFVNIFQLPPGEIESRGNFYALMFFVIGIGCLLVYFTMGWVSNVASQYMIRDVRRNLLTGMLRQDIRFFDHPENTVGALTGKLDSVAQSILELMTINITIILINVFSIVSCSILAIIVSWKLGLVAVFGGLPCLLFAGYARIRLETRMDDGNSKRFSGSAAIASEAVLAIRTVSSLAIENSVLQKYTGELDHAIQQSLLPLAHMMFWFSFTQSIEYFILALGFWYGSKLVTDGEATLYQLFVSFLGVFYAGQNASILFGYSSSITKGRSAVNYYAWIQSLQPTIQETAENRDCKPKEDISLIEFEKVQFSYPTRPDTVVLNGVGLRIRRGEFIALVGASGSGKSTMVSMLERFYDPISGTISIDSDPLTALNPAAYRSRIALVQQEPTLYPRSIRDNVLLGLEEDTNGELPATTLDAKVESALRAANAWDFVVSLPEGMNTPCGTSGSQLSGGQRQRIAIARALIRDPNVLLLDEATSALDSASERIVQNALAAAAASKARITVAVAHRLSTIKEADRIYVFQGGRIVEAGSHEELLALGGLYRKMCEAQSLDN